MKPRDQKHALIAIRATQVIEQADATRAGNYLYASGGAVLQPKSGISWKIARRCGSCLLCGQEARRI